MYIPFKYRCVKGLKCIKKVPFTTIIYLNLMQDTSRWFGGYSKEKTMGPNKSNIASLVSSPN